MGIQIDVGPVRSNLCHGSRCSLSTSASVAHTIVKESESAWKYSFAVVPLLVNSTTQMGSQATAAKYSAFVFWESYTSRLHNKDGANVFSGQGLSSLFSYVGHIISCFGFGLLSDIRSKPSS